MRRAWLILLLGLLACDRETLYQQSNPDAEVVVDAGLPDADVVAPADAAVMDAEPEPVADEPVYIHTGDTLYSYDPVNEQITFVGNFADNAGPIDGMVDIAIDRDGRMFGGDRDQRIYRVDPETGFARFVFDFDDILHGLTFLPDGTLVVAGERVSLIDPTNGDLVRELTGLGTYQTSGDIVGLPDGNLYWTVRGESGGNDELVRINPSSGQTRWLGQTTVTNVYGLGYADGSLYGFSASGVVVTLDPTSGSVMGQHDLEGRWWGATTNPVLW